MKKILCFFILLSSILIAKKLPKEIYEKMGYSESPIIYKFNEVKLYNNKWYDQSHNLISGVIHRKSINKYTYYNSVVKGELHGVSLGYHPDGKLDIIGVYKHNVEISNKFIHDNN